MYELLLCRYILKFNWTFMFINTSINQYQYNFFQISQYITVKYI
jgi:hypothetical protein